VYIAALSAIAEQNTEITLLQNAIRIGTTPLLVSALSAVRQATLESWSAPKCCQHVSLCLHCMPPCCCLQNYINSTIFKGTTNVTDAQFQYQQLINATCGCFNTPLNSTTAVTWGSSGLLLNAFNNSYGGITNWADYQTQVCAPNNAGELPSDINMICKLSEPMPWKAHCWCRFSLF
jgi:hypothetical protein